MRKRLLRSLRGGWFGVFKGKLLEVARCEDLSTSSGLLSGSDPGLPRAIMNRQSALFKHVNLLAAVIYDISPLAIAKLSRGNRPRSHTIAITLCFVKTPQSSPNAIPISHPRPSQMGSCGTIGC